MRKSDIIHNISEKTGIPKVDVLVTVESMIKEIKENIAKGENIYIRGFGSFITKKRAAKIGRNIKKNVAAHFVHVFVFFFFYLLFTLPVFWSNMSVFLNKQ